MWLNLKLRLIQTDDGYSPEHSKGGKWVVVQLKAGYTANSFPPAEGQRVSENFYKFISSLSETGDPIGIYRIVANETGKPDTSYWIGNFAPPELKVWRYERTTKRLFFGAIETFTGTSSTQNSTRVETNFDLILEEAIPITNGFVLNDSSKSYGKGEVLIKSWTDKPFRAKGKIYWESGRYF